MYLQKRLEDLALPIANVAYGSFAAYADFWGDFPNVGSAAGVTWGTHARR
jgi:hypothetical protein